MLGGGGNGRWKGRGWVKGKRPRTFSGRQGLVVHRLRVIYAWAGGFNLTRGTAISYTWPVYYKKYTEYSLRFPPPLNIGVVLRRLLFPTEVSCGEKWAKIITRSLVFPNRRAMLS